MPALAIATRVEEVIARLAAVREAPRALDPCALADELEAIANDVRDTYCPGVEPLAAATEHVAAATDETLERLRVVAAREAAEARDAVVARERARSGIPFERVATGTAQAELRRFEVLADVATHEALQATDASELLTYVALDALDASPALRVVVAARTLATILRLAGEAPRSLEGHVDPTIFAMALAAATRLARAAAACLPEVASEIRALRFPGRCGGDDDGPYRRAPVLLNDPEEVERAATRSVLDRSELPDAMGRYLRHATVLASLEAAMRARGGWTGALRRALGARTGAEIPDLEPRASWHRARLAAQRDLLVACCIRSDLPRIVAGEAVAAMMTAVMRVRAVEGRQVWARTEAIDAVAAARSALGAVVGCGPSREAFAEAVAPRLRGGNAEGLERVVARAPWVFSLEEVEHLLRLLVVVQSDGPNVTLQLRGAADVNDALRSWLADITDMVGLLPRAADVVLHYAEDRFERNEDVPSMPA